MNSTFNAGLTSKRRHLNRILERPFILVVQGVENEDRTPLPVEDRFLVLEESVYSFVRYVFCPYQIQT